MDDPEDSGALGAVRQETALRVMKAIRRGLEVAAAAAGYCAVGEKAAAWEAFQLAQSQYRGSLEMLLLADDLTPAQRQQAQHLLAALTNKLARIFPALEAAGSEPENHTTSGGRPETAGVAGHAPAPEIFRAEMMTAGQQLIEALNHEREKAQFAKDNPKASAEGWQEARKQVEQARQKYDTALMRYRDAVLRPPDREDEAAPPRTILLLEDDRAVADVLRKTLERRGAKVLHASAGEEALSICERYGTGIDLLVADVILSSGVYGMDVASRLAQHRSDLPVLFISGHPKEELVNRGLLNSDTGLFQRIDFLQKPFSIAALELRVQQLIGGADTAAGRKP